MQAILSSVACPALQRFSTLSHKRPHFQKNVVKHKMCVSIFSITFLWKMFHSKSWVRYDQKCVLVSVQSTRSSCPILMKLDLFRQIIEKCSDIKFNNNPSSGSRVVLCGQTHMTKLIVVFRNFANRLNTVISMTLFQSSRTDILTLIKHSKLHTSDSTELKPSCVPNSHSRN